VRHCRENGVPYLGICLGFQMAVVEYARNVCGIADAASTEFAPNSRAPVIDILPEQKKIEGLGGNMRLGGKDVQVAKDTLASVPVRKGPRPVDPPAVPPSLRGRPQLHRSR
jgi:CTP synthase